MVKIFSSSSKIIAKKKKIERKIATIYLFGVLYSIVKKKNKIYLKLHFSFNLSLLIPKTLQLYALKKRLIVSGDARHLKDFILNLMSLRSPNIYTGIGLRERHENFIVKAGKIRKR